MEWSASLNEYEKLVIRMNTPRVVIDNAVCSDSTLVKVDSARKHGIHLEAIRVLTDLDLSIRKAYISSDGQWFMDVFHVTDLEGNKLTNETVIAYLEQSLNSEVTSIRSESFSSFTCLELTGTDRLGLLSEIFAVISDLRCDVVESRVWTHIGRMAALIFIKDDVLEDPQKIDLITARLRNILNREHDVKGARVCVSTGGVVNADRRLHQMMFADRDYDAKLKGKAVVSVQNWIERGYSVVSVQCRDRAKLLFDVVCTLTDMQYAVSHGTIDTDSDRAHLEFYIRHMDETPISSDAERQRVIQCLQAAVERRSNEGLRLDLRTMDQQGLLAGVTRTFRENGLSITRAEISTRNSMATNTFYVTDAAGYPVNYKIIEGIIDRIGSDRIKIVEEKLPKIKQRPVQEEHSGVGLYYLGNFVKSSLYSLGLIRSCS